MKCKSKRLKMILCRKSDGKYNLKRDIAYITGLLHGYRDALWIVQGALTKQIRAKSAELDKLKEELEDANN